MYQEFYSLHSPPFDLTSDPDRLLLTPTHREALNMLQYGISARKGVVLLVGDAGTGKTTLLRKSLSLNRDGGGAGVDLAYLVNPTLSRTEFFQQLTDAFGLDPAAATSTTTLFKDLKETLITRRDAGLNTALIVDEAQSLPYELLEEVRLLANIESDTEKLLAIVLAGQPELADRLNEWPLRQLKQRVALRCALAPLTLNESAAYIAGRVRLAGGDAGRLFSRDAVIAIHARARGIPRTISVLCANALLTAFATGRPCIGADLIDEVSRDFDLQATTSPAASASPPPATVPQNVRAFRAASALRSPSAGWPDLARRMSQKLWMSR